MQFNELVKKAPLRTARADFRGLFGLDIVVTPNNEISDAIREATKQTLNTTTGQYESELDQEKLRVFLISRVVGFSGLTLRKAMTLCGRDLPEDMAERGNEPLPWDNETVGTLLAMVVGLQTWLFGQLRTLGAEAARREEAALGN